MILSMIYARDLDGVIAIDGKLPWKQKRDIAWFRSHVKDKIVIIGRKTLESIPTHHWIWGHTLMLSRTNPNAFKSVEEVLAQAQYILDRESLLSPEVMVIGGAEIYNMFLPHIELIYETQFATYVEYDDTNKVTKLNFDFGKLPMLWHSQVFEPDKNNNYPYMFCLREGPAAKKFK